MGLETGDFISDLVQTNPTGLDSKAFGDDHFRLIKKVLKQTFPALDAAVGATPAQLNQLVTNEFGAPAYFVNGLLGAPSISFGNEPTLGIYRPTFGDTMDVVADGASMFRFNKLAHHSYAPAGLVDGALGAETLALFANNDTDTGLYFPTTDAVALAAAGVDAVRLSAANGNVTGLIEGGIYTPALAGLVNVAAATAYEHHYQRIGNTCFVSGRLSLDPTAAGAIQLQIFLPVAPGTAFVANTGATGFGNDGTNAQYQVLAITGTATIVMVCNATGGAAARDVYYSFSYRIN